MFEFMVAKKKSRTRLAQLIACALLIPALILVGSTAGAMSPVFIGSLVVTALIVFGLCDLTGWTEANYYLVPGSRDSTGEHRCIHCAGRGIYRHGQYKSYREYADCSKCKKPLWSS